MAGKDNLTPFTSTYQPKNNGRKPNHLKKYLKANNVGTADIRVMLGSILADVKTLDDVKAKLEDPNTPPLILFPIKALLADFLKGKVDTYFNLMRYAYGEPKQEIETRNLDDVTTYTPEQREEMEAEFLKELVKEKKEQIKGILDEQENDSN